MKYIYRRPKPSLLQGALAGAAVGGVLAAALALREHPDHMERVQARYQLKRISQGLPMVLMTPAEMQTARLAAYASLPIAGAGA